MPIVPAKLLLDRAFKERYGVAAINVVNDLTMEAVLASAEKLRAPVIVQTSVKHVVMAGVDVMYGLWVELTRHISVPVALHLDHCSDRSLISRCLAKGWNSVLFDGSSLAVEENKKQCIEIVQEARGYGAHVEGEVEGFRQTDDASPGNLPESYYSLETLVDFVKTTGIDVFAPAIGNAHGVYAKEPRLDGQRVSDIVEATGVPVALHGGTGMTPEQFSDLIRRGCAKVNVSTALKIAFMKSARDHMANHPNEYDPPSLFRAQRAAVIDMAGYYIRLFGSEGKSWT